MRVDLSDGLVVTVPWPSSFEQALRCFPLLDIGADLAAIFQRARTGAGLGYPVQGYADEVGPAALAWLVRVRGLTLAEAVSYTGPIEVEQPPGAPQQ